MATGFQVVIDCANPNRVATFWASALGYKLQDPPDGYATWDEFLTSIGVPEDEWNNASAVVDPDGVGPRLYFQRVPEGKVVKNRVHMDVNVGGGLKTPIEERKKRVGAEVERLKGEGATVLRPNEERGEYWVVMQDPEGNEFCLQ
jgi:catechol 2,3-dioxygenase-like lactoylglutathione lyase family enzyme